MVICKFDLFYSRNPTDGVYLGVLQSLKDDKNQIYFHAENYTPVCTQRCFNVYKTSTTLKRRRLSNVCHLTPFYSRALACRSKKNRFKSNNPKHIILSNTKLINSQNRYCIYENDAF